MTATVAQCVLLPTDPVSALRPVDGHPVIWWVLRELSRFGVTDCLLLSDAFPADVATGLPRPVRVTLAPDPSSVTLAPDPSSPRGALLAARDLLQDRFLLCDGSTLLGVNIAPLLAAAAEGPAEAGPLAPAPNSGVTVVRKRWLENASWPGGAKNVSTPATTRPPTASTDTANPNLHRNALFLDRDGVLNLDHGYIATRDRFDWIDGALDAIRYATEAGWHVFVVTNQSGVARGMFTEDAVRALLAWIADEARRTGGTIDDTRYCPFHPQGKLDAYRQDHPWRKPRPGMLLDLIDSWQLDPARAVMVGDQPTDMQAAASAGVAGHLFPPGGNLLSFIRPIIDRATR